MGARLRVIVACCALLGAAAPIYAADGLTLSATAGLDGLARAGRWVPVHITIEARGSDIAGDLSVSWGDARIRRPVALAAPSRRTFVLYIRTGDARDSLTAQLEDGGRVLTSATAPVRLLDEDEPVTLCIDEPADGCTVTVAAASLGASPRAFDVADEIRDADERRLDPDQQDALGAWREMRRLERTVDNAPALGTVPPAAAPSAHASGITLAYLLLVAAGLLGARRVRTRPLLVYPAIAIVVIVGATAGVNAGRRAPVVIHHATMIEEFVGAREASLVSRGVAEFPGAAPGVLSWPMVDGAADVVDMDGSSAPGLEDATGAPAMRSDDTIGARRTFRVEGFVALRLLEVARSGTVVRVTNVSGMPLERCTWPAGFASAPAALGPGAFADATAAFASDDPAVSCIARALPVAVKHDRTGVVADGETAIVLHLPPAVSR